MTAWQGVPERLPGVKVHGHTHRVVDLAGWSAELDAIEQLIGRRVPAFEATRARWRVTGAACSGFALNSRSTRDGCAALTPTGRIVVRAGFGHAFCLLGRADPAPGTQSHRSAHCVCIRGAGREVQLTGDFHQPIRSGFPSHHGRPPGGVVEFDVVIEIPKGQRNSSEIEYEVGPDRLDRTLFTATSVSGGLRLHRGHAGSRRRPLWTRWCWSTSPPSPDA